MNMKRRTALQLLGASAGTAFLGAPQIVFGQDLDQIVVAVDDIPEQLDPLLNQLNPGYRTLWNIYDSLLTVDYLGDGSVQPALAESWQRVDGRTLELTLREGVTFHDSSPLTVEDVVFSFGPERRTDPESPGYGTAQQFLNTIETVEAVDDRTIRVTSSVDDPTLELRLTAWGSQIVSKAAFEAAGGFEGFAQAPVGTGPFKVVSISADTIELEAFADYWGGAPDIERLVFRQAPELSSRIAGLVSGDFDIIVDVPADQFAAVEGQDGLEIVGGNVASIRVVKFDTRNETLADPRIRRALALSIDRQAIVDALWGGLVSIPNGHQLPSFGALYDPDRPDWQYDPDAARALMEEAGYDGTAIPYRIRVAAYGPELATAQVLVSMWEAVGFNIDMQIKENFGQLLEFPGTGMRNGVDPVLVADPLFGFWRSYNESEREVWENEPFYELGHRLESSLDVEERKDVFGQMMDIFDEDPPAFILHQMGTFYGKRTDISWEPSESVFLQFAGASID
ncbi:peptide ABC transporter substrate-binding protein [Rhodobacterales bacterium HKCCE2091]|nr:peptide ABC transporter substrate-binding protein [Rhodobacterales bacterium HKCCE2091]